MTIWNEGRNVKKREKERMTEGRMTHRENKKKRK